MAFPAFPLWEFQEEDITNFEEQEAVLLAWEMGTGKSPSALERDRRIRLMMREVGGKTLIVAPMGTHRKWEEWFLQNTPLTVSRINSKDRYAFLRKPAHVYIVHWEALRLLPKLQDIRWLHIIADEVHKAKNNKAKQTKALKKIKCDFKTGLSGTPATNRPQDFWSVLHWLKPKMFPSQNRFIDMYCEFGEVEYGKGQKEYRPFLGPKNVDHLLNLIRPFYSRHLKKEQCCAHHPEGVMPWLPDKTYDDIEVELLPIQRRAYDAMEQDMLAWVGKHEGEPIAAPIVISQLHRLQQFALGYLEPFQKLEKDKESGEMVWVTKYKMIEPSAKIDAVIRLLEDNPEESFLIYSQWKAPLVMLGARLEKHGISHSYFTGSETEVQRERSKRAFVSGDDRVLLGTIGAGGTGVDDLQLACKTVVFLDRTWSPAENKQAEDRLHRGGQKDVVQVIDIIAKDTVDLGRHARLEEKWDWIKQLLGDKQVRITN
jgi:SNF2 family DNA or RNA helicase